MNALRTTSWCMLTALVTIGTIGMNEYVAAQQVTEPGQVGMEVLTRGPLHEAFAETISYDPEPGIVVAKAPPDRIEEIAPNQRPVGADVNWIPGYWGWDDERNDYLWVSGIWRNLPPGRQWIPGYWGQSPDGFQWTSGYWADAAASEIDYLPEPPASLETGPNVAAPSEDATWLPGSWVWQQNRYGWRAGYWTKGNQNWDWTPDHYVWTPSGYVYVDGYYDHSVQRRGIVFAPVYFDRGLRTQRGFSYSPSTVINAGVFARHLFLRPSYGHYYFGDYYDSNYANSGYSPWFSYQSSRQGYDPIYANQRWQHRHDRGWADRAQADFRSFRDNEAARPPHNWAAQRERAGQAEQQHDSNRTSIVVAAPLDELTQRTDGHLRFRPVDPAERQQFGQRGQAYRTFLQQRQQLEATATNSPTGDPAAAAKSSRRTFSTSPFVAQPADRLGKDNVPPQRHQVLKPDFQIQPQPRVQRGAAGTRPGFDPGAAGGPSGQMQIGPQGQQQRQGANQGNRRGARGGQPQDQNGQAANRGRERQGRPNGQQQGATSTQQQPAPSNPQPAASGGQQQGASGGQSQGSPSTPAADPSE